MKTYFKSTKVLFIFLLLGCLGTKKVTQNQSEIEFVKSKKWQLIKCIEIKGDKKKKERVKGLIFHFSDSLINYYRPEKELVFNGAEKVQYEEASKKIFIYDSEETKSEYKIELVKPNRFIASVEYIDTKENKTLYWYTYYFKAID